MTPTRLTLLITGALLLGSALVIAFERARDRSLARGWDALLMFAAGCVFLAAGVVGR